MKQVRSRVIVFDQSAARLIDLAAYRFVANIFGQMVNDMINQVVFFFGVQYLNHLRLILVTPETQRAFVARLPAAFGVKRCPIEYHLKLWLCFNHHRSVLCNVACTGFELVVSHKLHIFFVAQNHPIAHLFLGISAASVALLLQSSLEPNIINRQAAFGSNEACQIYRKTERVK